MSNTTELSERIEQAVLRELRPLMESLKKSSSDDLRDVDDGSLYPTRNTDALLKRQAQIAKAEDNRVFEDESLGTPNMRSRSTRQHTSVADEGFASCDGIRKSRAGEQPDEWGSFGLPSNGSAYSIRNRGNPFLR